MPNQILLHARTSLSESLVTTLLDPAEQFTTFHAAREGRESGTSLPLPTLLDPVLLS